MEDHELHELIKQTSQETARHMGEEIRTKVDEGVSDALTRVGIDMSDPIEVQKDMSFLSDWRKTTKAVKRKGAITAAGILVTGILGAVWLGVKSMMG
jgi:hypothetical protein